MRNLLQRREITPQPLRVLLLDIVCAAAFMASFCATLGLALYFKIGLVYDLCQGVGCG